VACWLSRVAPRLTIPTHRKRQTASFIVRYFCVRRRGPRFKAEHPVTKFEGDHDVFGDGSVTIISTPGHTPGHQSLLVRLPKTGGLLLTGDAVHFKDNWENRRVPDFNTDSTQTLASMQRISGILAKEKAQLWINHDKVQSDSLKFAPSFYE
jgi:N-acyl homoserine lactone hydrolase